MRRIRKRLTRRVRSLRGANAAAVIRTLNPIIRGWAAYYRSGGLQRGVHRAGPLPVERSPTSGPARPPEQVEAAGSPPATSACSTSPGQDRWVFGDRDSGAYLVKFAWTKIVRHQLVKGTASPDDPALAEYWAERRRKGHPRSDEPRPAPARAQRRPLPDLRGLPAARRPRAAIPARVGTVDHRSPDEGDSARHALVRDDGRHVGRSRPPVSSTPTATDGTSANGSETSTVAAQRRPRGLLEPDAVKVARPVLRGPGRSNAPGLPDPTLSYSWPDLDGVRRSESGGVGWAGPGDGPGPGSRAGRAGQAASERAWRQGRERGVEGGLAGRGAWSPVLTRSMTWRCCGTVGWAGCSPRSMRRRRWDRSCGRSRSAMSASSTRSRPGSCSRWPL